ncbi:hypothetical protein AB0C40_32480 [Streptomyces brevispora]|uniref:hypothetical protein n=1 Tax=Streptomyces brevispora TaxID=887462 RepID=UPI002E34ADB8|nr:hypothetical protein [Streptomyces brevispora]
MFSRTKYGILVATALLTLPLLAHQASADPPAPYSDSRLAAMSPEEQARILAPLRQAAQSAITLGREHGRDVFTGAEIAPGYRGVNVYLTDLSQKQSFLREMRQSATKPGSARVTFKQGQHTRAELQEAITSLHRQGSDLPFTMVGASAAVDGSRITVFTPDTDAADSLRAGVSAASGIPVDVRQDAKKEPMTRENDSAPFYAGAALDVGAAPERSHCTSGIPAVSTWDGRQWLVTAAHCYNVNDVVHTHGGRVVGSVWAKLPEWDAEFIETSTYRQTWDGTDATGYSRYLNGWGSTVNNDWTCQLGYNTKVMCNLKVINSDYYYTLSGTTTLIKGVYALQQDGVRAVQGGDSGGPVVTVNDPNSRQINGIVSASSSTDQRAIFWVDVADIFSAFAIKLNPS